MYDATDCWTTHYIVNYGKVTITVYTVPEIMHITLVLKRTCVVKHLMHEIQRNSDRDSAGIIMSN